MNKLEIAQDELIREAMKAGKEIRMVKDGTSDFVKVRSHAYSHPEEIRELYMQAFQGLMLDGKLKCLLHNKSVELYEVLDSNGQITCKSAARSALLLAAQEYGHIYKVHCSDGEFVQAGDHVFGEVEEERILFLQVLVELFREQRLRLVTDSKEVAHYEPAQPRFAHAEAEENVVCLPPAVPALRSS
jgi:hypothetical protein